MHGPFFVIQFHYFYDKFLSKTPNKPPGFKRIHKFILPQTIIYEQQNYFFILLMKMWKVKFVKSQIFYFFQKTVAI